MRIPSLKKLERALHIRGTIETLQSELVSLFTNLGDAISHAPPRPPRVKAKPPFADEFGGAKQKRLAGRSKAKTAKRKGKGRKKKTAAREKVRIRNILTGGEADTAPVAAEPKMRRGKAGKRKTGGSAARKKSVSKKAKH